MPESQIANRLPSGREADLTISREYINVETLEPPTEKDPDWRFVDPAGHVHTYRSRRWKWVVTGYCGCAICACDDEPFEWGEFRCTVCGALVEPGRRPAPPPPPIPGLLEAWLKVTTSEGRGMSVRRSYFLRQAELDALTWPAGVTDEWIDLVAAREPEMLEPIFNL